MCGQDERAGGVTLSYWSGALSRMIITLQAERVRGQSDIIGKDQPRVSS